MKKRSIKKYNCDDLNKDFTISFLSGLGAGATMWYFSYISKYLSKETYQTFLFGFVIYIVIGTIAYLFLRWEIMKAFGKN